MQDKIVTKFSKFSRISGGLLISAGLLLASCATGGKFADNDSTGSIAVAGQETTDDVQRMRETVTATHLSDTNTADIAWSNRETGSKGTIFEIAEYRRNQTVCRRYRATWHSFHGVMIYVDAICRLEDGRWVPDSENMV